MPPPEDDPRVREELLEPLSEPAPAPTASTNASTAGGNTAELLRRGSETRRTGPMTTGTADQGSVARSRRTSGTGEGTGDGEEAGIRVLGNTLPSAWADFEDDRRGRNVHDADAPPVGPYRGEVGSLVRRGNGSVEFEADARAEVADTELFVVRMGERAGRWATYPHRTLEGALAEARGMARRYAVARADEAAHGFRSGGDDPLHDLALPTQWSDRDQPDLVWRNRPYTEIGIFRIASGTPYIASQVAPQPEGEDVAAGIAPRMRRGGAMQIQLASPGALEQVSTIPIPDVPRPDVAAIGHEVVRPRSFTPGRSRSGTLITTRLPNGEVITGTSIDERTLGVPTRHVRGIETARVDPVALNAAARSALKDRIAFDERIVQLMEREENPSAARRRNLATLQQGLERRRSDLTRLQGNAEPVRVRSIIERNGLDVGDEPLQTVSGSRTETSLGPSGLTRERVTTHSGETDATLEERSSLTVGPGGITRTEQDRLTTTDQVSATRRTTTHARSDRLSLSEVSRTDESSTAEVDSTGATTSSERSSIRSIRAGGGRLTASRSDTRRRALTLDDGAATATEATRERSASLVHGESGSGVAAGGSESRSMSARGVELGVRTGGEGAFTVNVEGLDTRPPTYRITTTIHLGASLGGTARRQRGADQPGARATAGVSARISGDLVYSRTLDADEARRYLGDLDQVASGLSRDGRPEYGLLARARAVRAHGDADPSVVVDAESARAMADGETMDLDLGWGADVSVGAGGQSSGERMSRSSVGVSGSLGTGGGRRIRVARSGQHLLVTVTVRAEDRRSGSLGGGYGVSSMTLGGSESEGQSSSVAFRLRPDDRQFDAQFGEIASLSTERHLVRYADTHQRLVRSRTGGASRESSRTTDLGVGPVGLRVGRSGRRRSTLSTESGQLTGTQSGGQTTSGSISIAGREVLRGSHRTDLSATVSATAGGDAELNVTLTETQSDTSYSEGANEISRRFSERRTEDDIAEVATRGSDLINELLTAQAVRLTEYDLDQRDVDRVVERARNERIWDYAISRRQLVQPWARLRSALLNPQPTRAWLEADTTDDKRFAKKVAQADALASFMEDYAEEGGGQAMRWVLREWDAGIGFNFRPSTAEDIGTLREWPPSLAATRQLFVRLKNQVLALNRTLQRMLPNSSDSEASLREARRLCDELRSRLARVGREIDASNDFEQPRAKLEMGLEINRLRRQVSSRLRRFEEAAASAGTLPTTPVSDPTPQELLEQRERRHADLEAAEQACMPEEATPVDPALTERVTDMIRLLRVQRTQYDRLLNQAFELIPEDAGGGAEWFWEASAGDAESKFLRAASQHEEWIRRIRDLRALYRAAAVPEREWKVKPNAEANQRALDPDIRRLIRYYTMIQEWRHDSWGLIPTMRWREIVAQWQSDARY